MSNKEYKTCLPVGKVRKLKTRQTDCAFDTFSFLILSFLFLITTYV